MRIEDNKLIIDAPMNESDADELLVSLKQNQISKVIVECDELHASIIQILWCVKNEKKVKIKVDFLKPFFENITQRTSA